MIRCINVGEMVEKEVVGFGNGSIVYTPKKWIGKTVLVVLEKKPIDIPGETMRLLKPYLSSIEGVFLYGSFARNEQAEGSDMDILVVSNAKIGLGEKTGFDFLVKTREEIMKGMENSSWLFLHQIMSEARPIFNKPLLEELRRVKAKPDFGGLLEGTLGAFRKTSELLGVDRKRGKKHCTSNACIYSLVLRLKSLFIAQLFMKKGVFSSKGFGEFIKRHGFGEKTVNAFLETYRAERDCRKTPDKILLSDVERLFEAAKIEFLKTERMVK